MGVVLIPELRILRLDANQEPYYIYFSRDTIAKAQELYMSQKLTDKATLQHAIDIEGTQVVESWIVEDTERDKTSLYGLNAIPGSWAISMKINNDHVWNTWVKTRRVKGFSIEGIFKPVEDESERILRELRELLS
jgi:hypothetical protein